MQCFDRHEGRATDCHQQVALGDAGVGRWAFWLDTANQQTIARRQADRGTKLGGDLRRCQGDPQARTYHRFTRSEVIDGRPQCRVDGTDDVEPAAGAVGVQSNDATVGIRYWSAR